MLLFTQFGTIMTNIDISSLRIEGDQLFIKKILVPEISDSVMNWFNDQQLMKYYTNSRRQITKDTLLSAIEEGEKKGNQFTFGIYHKDKSNLIGTLKLGPINFNHKTSDLVALIGNRDYLGKGLAPKAIALGNELAFNYFDIRKLYGGMYESNIPSIKAYLRAGWLVEARLKGQYLVDGNVEDRIEVACFNPKYFNKEYIQIIKDRQKLFYTV